MALTIVRTGDSSRSPLAEHHAFKAKITFDSSYPTGGEAITSAELFPNEYPTAFEIMPGMATNGTLVVPVMWDAVNKKLKVFDMSGAEQSNATDLSTYYCEAMVFTW